MLSTEEKQYLTWLTAEAYEGWGAIIDLGPWLGSSSAALAEGLVEGGHQASVHSYDLFRWEEYMNGSADLDLEVGADFQDQFRLYTEPWKDRIKAHKGDLHATTWGGGPIEILFVDAAKSWSLLEAILDIFGSSLEPGRSRVVLQDHRHFHHAFLPLVFDGQPDLWSRRESVDVGTTVTFTPRQPVPAAGMARQLNEGTWSFLESTEILEACLLSEAGFGRRCLRLTHLYLSLCDDDSEIFDRCRESVFLRDRLTGDHIALREGWQKLQEGHHAAADQIALSILTGDPTVAEATLLRARISQAKGETQSITAEQVERSMKQAFDRLSEPHPSWALLENGDRAQLPTAHRLVEDSVLDEGETSESLFLLGLFRLTDGKKREARTAFLRSLELDPSSPHVKPYLGPLYLIGIRVARIRSSIRRFFQRLRP